LAHIDCVRNTSGLFNVLVCGTDDGSLKTKKRKRMKLKADVDEGLTVFIR